MNLVLARIFGLVLLGEHRNPPMSQVVRMVHVPATNARAADRPHNDDPAEDDRPPKRQARDAAYKGDVKTRATMTASATIACRDRNRPPHPDGHHAPVPKSRDAA